MLPETYKKVMIEQFSEDPHTAMVIVETKMYPPGPNEIVVKNRYVGANFTDVPRMIGLAKAYQKPPFDAGIDALGEVVQVGSAVRDFAVGDQVVTAFFGNGFREYSLIDSRFAAKITEPSRERLGLVISGTMASIMLRVVAGYKETTPRQRILVTAGVGDVGHYVVQLAKYLGHYVISSCGTADEGDILTELGVDRVIVREKEDVEQVILAEYPEKLDLVIDSFGGHYFNIGLDNLAPRGRFISSGALVEHTRHEGHIHSIDLYNKLIIKGATLHGFSLVEYAHLIGYHQAQIVELHQAGKIRTILDPKIFKGIDSIPDAVAHMMSWKTRGKVIIEL